MSEKPILFQGAMVRAILEARKTQTRRLVKPQPSDVWRPTVGLYHPIVVDRNGVEQPGPVVYGAADENEGRKCPYGMPTEHLWVRETWAHVPVREPGGGQGDQMGVIYRADGDAAFDVLPDEWEFIGPWKPSIHMPRWASRITLEVCSVRVERLCDISEADALAEGISWPDRNGRAYRPPIDLAGVSEARIAAERYRELWESIHGADSWDLNPWVFVIHFRRIKP